MERAVWVYVELEDGPCLVGRLWSRLRKGRESASFEYDKAWLEHPERFALEPAMALGPGPQHTASGKALFGAIGDSAPDRWGRILMRRAGRGRAEEEKRTPRTLMEIDYLLMVDDEARQGALRFAEEEGGPYLAPAGAAKIPPLVELPRLLAATEHVTSETDTKEDIRLLLAPGSSLGGARPKASVRDRDGRLAFAKFPSRLDEINVEVWEALAFTLAQRAGIAVPEWRLETVAGRPALLVRRFDRREGGKRRPFLSAMSMLGASDHEQHSYVEIVDALRQYGADPAADLQELWRRVVYSVLISNTDDHLRNHGFLYARGSGWRLSPAYDLNPVPVDLNPRILSTAITLDDPTASLGLTLEVAESFGVSGADARRVAKEIAAAVAGWRKVAAELGLALAEIERMASAFEHADSKAGLAL